MGNGREAWKETEVCMCVCMCVEVASEFVPRVLGLGKGSRFRVSCWIRYSEFAAAGTQNITR